MFTGIIRGLGRVDAIDELPGLRRIRILLPENARAEIEIGASISVDGVCLTVTDVEAGYVRFDVMQESLRRTALGALTVGSAVNIERAAKDGAEIGGHPISGHIDCTARILQRETPENNLVLTFGVPDEFMKYIFPKGYIALNGTSLTISGVDRAAKSFQVWFIPETLRLTTFGEKRVGDAVNLEIERGTRVTVDTVRTFLEERLGSLLPAIEEIVQEQLGERISSKE